MTDPLTAQNPAAPDNPDAAARAFFAALEAGRHTEAAALVHPTALARSRERSLAELRARGERAIRPMTAEDFLHGDPRMPRELAEYQAARANEHMPEDGEWALRRAGVASSEELEGMSPAEAFARFLGANDEGAMVRQVTAREPDASLRELVTRAAPRTVRTVIGSVPARAASGEPLDDAAYVTYTIGYVLSPIGRGRAEHARVIGARLDGAAWKIDFGDSPDEVLGGISIGYSVLRAEGEPFGLAEWASRAVTWPEEGAPRLRASMAGSGADPLREPPTTLILEELAADGGVAARVEIPAEAWPRLEEAVSLWSLLVGEGGDAEP
jgi:hypothetical protein